jgi:hypothetical protein
LLALWLPGIAWGQAPAEPPPFDPSAATPLGLSGAVPSAPAEPVKLGRRTQWVQVGPAGEDTFVDIAVHPVRATIWATVRDDGAVWISTDAGTSWVQSLRGDPARLGRVSDDEQVLLDVQARVDEIVDDLPSADDFGDPDDLTDDEIDELQSASDEIVDATADVLGGVQTEVDGGQWLGDLPTAGAGLGRPRVRFTATGMLLVARADGLRVSADLGTSWLDVLSSPISDVAEVGPGEVLAVGPEGSWFTTDLVQWTPATLPMEVAPYDLVVDGGTFASGPDGVWFATGGVWQQLPGASGHPPLTVRPTRTTYDRSLMVATRPDLLRAERIDVLAAPVIGGPLSGVADIERLAEDQLIAATGLGPYESMDGGKTWTLLDRGLDDPRAAAVAVAGGTVVLVGAGGVYRLDPLPEVLPEPEPSTPRLEPFVPLGVLIDTATTRDELRQRIGRRVVAALTPQVTTEYLTRRRVGPDWENNDPDGTALDLDGYWQLRTVLSWTPGRQRTSTSFDAEREPDDLPVVVVGREVVVDDGEAPQVLYSKVTRGATSYRSVLAGRITEIYRLRARLLLEGEPRDLLRAVQRQLRVDELEASLDAFTDGAVTRWKLDPTNLP